MSGVLRSSVRFSQLALDVVWESERLPDRHHALATGPAPGATEQDFAALHGLALDEFAGLGLAPQGRPHPDLVAALWVLTRPQREFYGYFGTDETRSGSFLAATDGEHTVLAVLDGDQVTLAPVRADQLDQAATTALPWVPPAKIRPITFAEADLDPRRRASTSERGTSFLVPGRPEREAPSVRQARALLGKPRTGGGMLYAAARDRLGRRRRAASQLSYADVAPDGRVLVQEQHGQDGARWITLCGAEPDLLARMLRRLAASIPN